jgi:hypothetical protein
VADLGTLMESDRHFQGLWLESPKGYLVGLGIRPKLLLSAAEALRMLEGFRMEAAGTAPG